MYRPNKNVLIYEKKILAGSQTKTAIYLIYGLSERSDLTKRNLEMVLSATAKLRVYIVPLENAQSLHACPKAFFFNYPFSP